MVILSEFHKGTAADVTSHGTLANLALMQTTESEDQRLVRIIMFELQIDVAFNQKYVLSLLLLLLTTSKSTKPRPLYNRLFKPNLHPFCEEAYNCVDELTKALRHYTDISVPTLAKPFVEDFRAAQLAIQWKSSESKGIAVDLKDDNDNGDDAKTVNLVRQARQQR